MTLFNVISGAASILSLLFAAFLFHRERIEKAREEGNVRILHERLRHVETTLRAAQTSLQLLIRRADHPDAKPPELQNLARAVRASLYGALLEAGGLTESLRDWRFGELFEVSISHERERLAAEDPDAVVEDREPRSAVPEP